MRPDTKKSGFCIVTGGTHTLIFSGFQHTGEIHQNLRGMEGLGNYSRYRFNFFEINKICTTHFCNYFRANGISAFTSTIRSETRSLDRALKISTSSSTLSEMICGRSGRQLAAGFRLETQFLALPPSAFLATCSTTRSEMRSLVRTLKTSTSSSTTLDTRTSTISPSTRCWIFVSRQQSLALPPNAHPSVA